MKPLRKILICGDRDWECPRLIYATLLAERGPIVTTKLLVITGGARGADVMAEGLAKLLGIHICTIPALWGSYAGAAGPIRNRVILAAHRDIAKVIAFHDDFERSKGTKDMVEIAKACEIETFLVRHDNQWCDHRAETV